MGELYIPACEKSAYQKAAAQPYFEAAVPRDEPVRYPAGALSRGPQGGYSRGTNVGFLGAAWSETVRDTHTKVG